MTGSEYTIGSWGGLQKKDIAFLLIYLYFVCYD